MKQSSVYINNEACSCLLLEYDRLRMIFKKAVMTLCGHHPIATCYRATTGFTGWPTPPTTPIPLEKLLEMAKTQTSSSSTTTTTSTTTSTTTTTTTTPRPTTPGVCSDDCDLAGTVKLVGGVTWVPELLDHNTEEWQDLASEVQRQVWCSFDNSVPVSIAGCILSVAGTFGNELGRIALVLRD